MKKQFVTYGFWLMCIVAFSQTKTALVNEGNFYFQNNDYFSSIFYYELALEKDSTLSSVFYPLAESYRHTHQYSNAIKHYRKHLASEFSSFYPNADLFLGMTLKNASDYLQASTVLQGFLDNHPSPSDYWYRKALMELKGCQLALSDTSNTIYRVTHLGDSINSAVSDFAPFVDWQGRLHFSSMQKDDGLAKELYIGHQSKLMLKAIGQDAKAFNVFNDVDYHIANISFNPDGSKVYFCKCKHRKEELKCDIYTSHFIDGFWQKSQVLDERFNPSGANNTHPQWALWNGQEGLFVSSDRIGGIGNLDIWFIPFVGYPEHLGNGINTQGNEVTPIYHSLEQVLYFSSDFHPGYGSYDVFKSKWQKDWGLVSHLGKPINSSANDLYYVAQLDSSHLGYFSSNRSGSKTISYESCCNDIYAFEKFEPCVCVAIDSIARKMQLFLPLSVYYLTTSPIPAR